MNIRKKAKRAGMTLLLLTAFAIPLAALAGLASFDLTGSARAAPPTMGALEAVSGTASTQLAAPTGLVVKLLRTSG